VLATLIIGGRFFFKSDKTFKYFGIALLLDAVAFTIWSIGIALKPVNLETYVTYGVVFFIASLVFFLIASAQDFSVKNRQIIIWLGVIVGAVVLYLRAFVYSSVPSFSQQGFFFFNPNAIVQMLYIFALVMATVPAIDAVASKFRLPYYNNLFKFGFLAQVAGGIVLLTSNVANPDTTALNVAGWIISLSYLALLTTFGIGKKAWI